MIVFAYLFYFIAASASPLQRRWLAKKNDTSSVSDQIAFAFRTVLICAVLATVTLPFFIPLSYSGIPYQTALLALAAGVFSAGFYIFSYVSQKHVEAGVSTLISNIYTPITIILATVFLGERLTGWQIIGTALLLAAMLIISKKHRIGRFRFDKYFMMMLASGAMLGVVLVVERALQKTAGFTSGTLISWWAGCICLGIIVLATRSRHVYSQKDTLITGVLRFLGNFSWTILIAVVGNLSLVSAVTTFKVVVMFIAGAIFLKEKEDLPKKIIGSLIAVLGLFLMK